MARARKPVRRQGVVYGPTQPVDRGTEANSLIGRILGMLVVAGALAVLVVGSLSLLGGSEDEPAAAVSPSATALARLTPFPSSPPTLPPPPTAAPTLAPPPSAGPSVGASAEPSLGPSPGLAVREGPGFVTFGTENTSNLRIVDPRTSFPTGQRITWSAHLTEPTSSASLRVELSMVDLATGAEELVLEEEVRPRVSSAQIFLRRLRPSELGGPGTYVVRYLRGEEVMSEGLFEVSAP